jgi:DNA-binding XRE family transcriptional regulator
MDFDCTMIIDHRTHRCRLAFDLERFDIDLRRVCNKRGISRRKAAIEIGVREDTLYFITHKHQVPSGVTMAAICKWSGLNCADYSINLEDSK